MTRGIRGQKLLAFCAKIDQNLFGVRSFVRSSVSITKIPSGFFSSLKNAAATKINRRLSERKKSVAVEILKVSLRPAFFRARLCSLFNVSFIKGGGRGVPSVPILGGGTRRSAVQFTNLRSLHCTRNFDYQSERPCIWNHGC